MTKIFFSICSAHQVPNEDCRLCKIGFWVDEEDAVKLEIVECEECGGTGFSGQGTGYDSVCDNCGGKGELPKY